MCVCACVRFFVRVGEPVCLFVWVPMHGECVGVRACGTRGQAVFCEGSLTPHSLKCRRMVASTDMILVASFLNVHVLL